MTTRRSTPPAAQPPGSVTLVLPLLGLLLATAATAAAGADLRGEASLTLSSSDAPRPRFLQADLRYVPQLQLSQPLGSYRDLTLFASCDAIRRNHIVSPQDVRDESDASLYRLWLRYAGDGAELRLGRQKLSFGSATLLRPLQWFDGLDPQDPLQVTAGVDALLARYYLPGIASVWLWGLYGNEDPRGLDTTPTARETAEYGGRLQSALGPGELALSYHHRRTDVSPLLPPGLPPLREPRADEDRLGLDGKWDVTVGLWFEVASVRQRHEIIQRPYTSTVCAGIDYTFDVGQGLTVLAEHLLAGRSDRLLGAAADVDVTAVWLRYPWGVLDEFHLVVYRDWQTTDRFHLLRWRRSYDHWSLDLQGFAGPAGERETSFFPGGQALVGSGLRLVIAFNH